MIPEREREALMRLTMCARNECDMCKYRPYIPKKCYERATEAMNVLADALNADRKDEPTISKMEQVEEPHIVGKHADVIIIDDSRLTAKCLNCANGGSYKCSKCDGEMYFSEMYFKDEPQTYVINPQKPTNDDKCFECDDFFTCGGQCNKIEDEPQTEREGE